MGMVGVDRSVLGVVCQAAVASPVTWFHVVNRRAISRRGTVRLTLIMIDIAIANTKCQPYGEYDHYILCLL
jgi:hypothetical protein